ncbi:MAG: LEPR-XLL domain-containing protein [Planctomycetes bacterium]|nr:LEPR-XLL domain-containing protein [Planctomycetota bacterium]
MSIWSSLKRGLGATGEPTRPEYPIFEHLEPRLLLSADPVGLASLVSLDDGEFEYLLSWSILSDWKRPRISA